MRLRTFGILAVAASAGLVQVSEALIRPRDAEAPFVAADRAPRTHRTTAFEQSGTLANAGLAGWTAIWDRDTEVPLRLWGTGPAAPGAVADPAIAEAAARRFLAAHLALLAPGAQPSDFELVGNALSRRGDVRSVGFQQRARGLRVLGGTIGFAFKADRLAMVSSTALPNVSIAVPAARLAPSVAAARATSWLASAGHDVAAKASPAVGPSELLVMPIVRPRVGAAIDVTYRVAEQVTVASIRGPGPWEGWIDAADGAPIARRSLLHYATGKVLFDVSDRHPNGTRSQRPSIFTTHVVDGVSTTSSADGTLTWTGAAAGTVGARLAGPFVQLDNVAGAELTTTLTLPAGGTVTWSSAANELEDAQLTSFLHASFVRHFAKTRLDPALAWIDEPLPVFVNESGSCNAFASESGIHFLRSSGMCQNTGRLADVIYHEYGHRLHRNSIIPGVGQFDGSVSEGMGDVLSSLLTNDSGLGRGFFHNNNPLRELNPPGVEKKWPDDMTGEVHDDGEIIGGTLWDLRVLLEAKRGMQDGYEDMLDIFYGILQRSSDIPSSYAEALLADDDDGNLANGTPNECEINAAFGAHGLADPTVTVRVDPPVRDNFNVSIAAAVSGNAACPGPRISSAVVDWKKRGDGALSQAPLTENAGRYEGAIPEQPEGTVVQYQVVVTMSDGTTVRYPNNPADPLYEFYVGPVEILKCFDFEAGFDGWTPGLAWQAGAPAGMGGDPKTAHGGTGVIGIDLTGDGAYPPMSMSSIESPEINLGGRTAVRLQFYRWLGVEDGFYDQARLLVNGTQVWSNFASVTDPQNAGINHIDREWRFVDHDLAQFAANGKVKLRFELDSDAGLDLSGWTLDDVCVVAMTGAALTCGNAVVDAGETCDDGNRDGGDGCSVNCLDESTGGDDPGGCCQAGTRPAGAFALSALVLGLALRRRRRARA